MDDKVNLAEKLALIDRAFSPKIIGELNDYKLELAKVKGEFVWHSHPDTDDFFLVLSGRVTIQLRDRDIELGPGELYVVPRGVEHCPKADEEEAHDRPHLARSRPQGGRRGLRPLHAGHRRRRLCRHSRRPGRPHAAGRRRPDGVRDVHAVGVDGGRQGVRRRRPRRRHQRRSSRRARQRPHRRDLGLDVPTLGDCEFFAP